MDKDNRAQRNQFSLQHINARADRNKLRSGLGERKLKTAVKTVFKNFGEYASFFVALFIIQSLLWLLCFSTSTNIARERQTIESEYGYHFAVEHLTVSDMAMLENTLTLKDYQTIRSYESYEIIPPDEYTDFYTLRVRLKSGSEPNTFIQYYLINNDINTARLEITFTPLYTYETEYVADNVYDAVWAGILLVVLSVIVMMSLFSIRLNHYKFMYGIYMSCGAGFSRLFSSSIWEMMIISFTTLVLSAVTSFGICATMFASVGVVVKWWMIPLVLVLNLLIVLLAVRVPVRHLSHQTPVSLIVAQDNSNLVSSPKRSFKIFNKSFPYHYELFSIWRFRWYFARTLVASILFTSIFLCTVYVGYMKKTDEAVMGPEFIAYADIGNVDITGVSEDILNIHDIVEIMNDAQIEAIETIDGVAYSLWVNETTAGEVNSHILLESDLMGGAAYSVGATGVQSGYGRATNMYSYTAMDKHFIDTLCELYQVDGDPYAVLNDGNKIIVSDALYNAKSFNFEPGDRVLAGKCIRGKLDASDYMSLSNKEILRKQLEKCVYEYQEYEIAAVVHDYEAEDSLLFGMNYLEYFAFTRGAASKSYDKANGSDVEMDGDSYAALIVDLDGAIKIFTEQGLESSYSEQMLSQIREGLDRYIESYGMDVRIQRNYRMLYHELVAQRHTYDRILIMAVLLLLLSPVVWFFSQLLFYFKREKEINILRMFGAKESSLKKLYSFAGLIMASLAIAVTVILGYLSSFGIYKLFNNVLVKYGMTSGTRYEFYVSVPALLICVLVSVLCGFLSSYIPYSVSKRRREREAVAQLSAENRG